jgi:hypothetical protein
LTIEELSPQEFLKRRAAGTSMTLLDVREDWETQLAPVPTGLKHIPMGQVADRLSELRGSKPGSGAISSGARICVGFQPRRRNPGVVQGRGSNHSPILTAVAGVL